MKKLWVIAMTCITTMVFAQQDQVKPEDQVKRQDEIKQPEDVKADPSKVSTEKGTSGFAGLNGKSFKITFDAKPAPERKDGVGKEQQATAPDSKSTAQTEQSSGEKNADKNLPGNKQQDQNIANPPAETRIESNATAPSITQDSTKVDQNNTASELQKSKDQNTQSGTVAANPDVNNQNSSTTAKTPSGYQLLDGKTLVLTFNEGQLEVSGNAMKDGNVTIESCSFNKTSGTGSLCTVVASCMSPGSTERSYWSALIDGSQITGSVYFTNAGTSEEYFKFTGKKTSATAKKSAARETSSLK